MSRYTNTEEWLPSNNIALTEEQLEVVRNVDANISLIAGPGTGKTEVLAQKANYILQTGICKYPYRILALSYKVDAANNLKTRVQKRCGYEFANCFQSMTVDSFLISIVRRFNVFLPEWLKIDGDFSIANDTIELEEEYTAQTNKIIQKDYYKLTNISEENRSFWLYCNRNNIFDYKMLHSMTFFIITKSKDVCNLLSSTYKFIFLDEFQDMSERHYPTLCKIFCNNYNIITAVGDFNQSIMGFAGAIPEIFNKFKDEFNSTEYRLTTNHRSYPKIVNFINEVAKYLAPENTEPLFYNSSKEDIEQSFIATATFDSPEKETEYVVDCIKKIMKEDKSLNFDDFSLILKQRAADYFLNANNIFLEHGVKLRNEDANACKNGVKIQDLMSDNFSKLVIYILKLKLLVINTEERRELDKLLSEIMSLDMDSLRDAKKKNKLKINILSSINMETKNASEWMSLIIESIGETKLIKIYRNAKEFNKVKDSITALLQKHINEDNDINSALDNYMGYGNVKLMTAHKSKGLEFDTVFFVDFKTDSWWTSKENQSKKTRDESIRCFFVGLSRAKKRLFFTNPDNFWVNDIANIINNSGMTITY